MQLKWPKEPEGFSETFWSHWSCCILQFFVFDHSIKFFTLFSPLQRSIKKSISAFHKNLIKLGNKQKYLKAKFQISKLIEEHFLCFLVEWKDGGDNDDDEDGDVINDDDGGKIDCSLIYDLSRDSICQKRTIILLGPCIIKLIYLSF